MRKIVFLVAVLALTATVSAKKVTEPCVFDVQVDVNNLGQYLDLTMGQRSEVIDIASYFRSEMNRVKYVKGSEQQQEQLKTAIYGNLKLMKSTLTEEQYRKYLRVLNATMNNNGLNAMLVAQY